ncbi:MAG: hypothetical protein A3I05_07730 [Deltaproteobacteria bacterium RIFCSPLOWO2_02_FULL_44_10]|nr:MAG: hypothetical protein A3C46_09495 [Deltaproteobacteria bacterium RIFCSPHIGHO2_02_FULL_44_16]OGQ46769.1 MAG: hypothetical protein A3I05_07730 [Deltaproteobacteria bacterium RIFCSPLOWO2_02_FULL_44_10]
MEKIIIGTRASKLALVQTKIIADGLRQNGFEIDIKEITTTGDRIKTSLAESGGKALFVKELEEALLEKKIDLAVHSLKDVPGFLPKGLTIACTPKREDARDVVIVCGPTDVGAHGRVPLPMLPQGAKLGTSSPRRRIQLQRLRPDLEIVPMRGNVDTRLKKLEAGEFDAIVLAAAGLKRLGILESEGHCEDPEKKRRGRSNLMQTVLSGDRHALRARDDILNNFHSSQHIVHFEYLETFRFIPAIGQGTLALETRENDQALIRVLQKLFNDEETWIATEAERALLQAIGGDCHTPVGAYARVQGDEILLNAFLAGAKGEKFFSVQKKGKKSKAKELGKEAGEKLIRHLC